VASTVTQSLSEKHKVQWLAVHVDPRCLTLPMAPRHSLLSSRVVEPQTTHVLPRGNKVATTQHFPPHCAHLLLNYINLASARGQGQASNTPFSRQPACDPWRPVASHERVHDVHAEVCGNKQVQFAVFAVPDHHQTVDCLTVRKCSMNPSKRPGSSAGE
jgi:hypothetical protein